MALEVGVADSECWVRQGKSVAWRSKSHGPLSLAASQSRSLGLSKARFFLFETGPCYQLFRIMVSFEKITLEK